MSFSIYDLTCDYLESPIGIDSQAPLFGWKLLCEAPDTIQTAWHIKVESENTTVWDSQRVESGQSTGIAYAGKPLESRKAYTWRLQAWNNHSETAVSGGSFEMALLAPADWRSKWVEPVQDPAYDEPPTDFMTLRKNGFVELDKIRMRPAQMIRRSFVLQEKPISRARAYATAHGIYSLELNGRKVGDLELTPENTEYPQYLQYQAYDVTDAVGAGENAICMTLADGWYCGKVGFLGRSCQSGDRTAGLFQLEVEYTDGTRQITGSDGSCKSATGAVQYADLFVGQKYDARLEKAGHSRAGYDDSGWQPVIVREHGYENLRAQYGEPVRVSEELRPLSVYQSPKGEWILDAGQVLAGRLRMRVRGERGASVMLEHSETVDKEGNYLNNIIGRFANQTDTYILKGGGEEVFEPLFTYHGFRYVRISGYPGTPSPDDFDVQVIQSDLKGTLEFSCSDERLNKLHQNIIWSQRGNMVSIPTDCPQREKVGWAGDVQVFSRTACYNMDMRAFFTRWLRNVRLAQRDDGQIPNVIPYGKAHHPGGVVPQNTHTSSGWGDVATILPWELYKAYGELRFLTENYDMMKRWVEYIRRTAENELPENTGELTPERRERMKYLWNTNFHFGDWLTPSVTIDPKTGDYSPMYSALMTRDYVPTCYYACSTELLAAAARELGYDEDASEYETLLKNIRQAFADEFVDENGHLPKDLQGIYVLALRFGLIPAEKIQPAVSKLVSLIEANGNRLDTGFMSVRFLLDVLQKNGRADMAYDLLFQDRCPSWLYAVKMGATSMWEAWRAVLEDGTPTSVSYNHYAFGCVGEWMYGTIGGLKPVEQGYKHFVIEPVPDERLAWADIKFESVYGPIKSRWERSADGVCMEVRVPANTTATVLVPGAKDHISCNGSETAYNNKTGMTLGSGTYLIT
jgi:alpha-L-rhamnosidase